MLRAVFEKLFRSVYWKLAIVVILFVLCLLLVRIFAFLSYLRDYYLIPGHAYFGEFSKEVEDIYVWGAVAAALLLMIVLAGIYDLFSYLRQVQRFRSITAVINEIANGDLAKRIDIRGHDEVAQLADSFNHMADIVVESFEKLRNSDKLRRELVQNVAHDLGGPVTSIRGYTETILLKEPQLSSADRTRFLRVILDNSSYLSKLVGELFDLSKFDAKSVVPARESFSILTLACDVASRFQPRAQEKQLSLSVAKAAVLPLVIGDLALVERVLANLIENAVKYTNSGGVIKIFFEQDQGLIWVNISDNGVGVPTEDLPLLFERFHRVDKGRSRREGGAGLGLAIVRSILEAHGSRIEVKSTLGVGSTFRFCLPKQC